MNYRTTIAVRGQGLYEITSNVAEILATSGISDGLATVFIRHTSASLVIQENADPAVLADLQSWLDKAVPEGDALYTHTAEGPDDMPAHVKGAITATHLAIPVMDGALALGTWQGIFLWEHRHHRTEREIIVNVSA